MQKTACPNHRKCSVLNSPRYPERATGSTSSPRTSRFPNSIIKQRYQLKPASIASRLQRQPLTIPSRDHTVKRSSNHFVAFRDFLVALKTRSRRTPTPPPLTTSAASPQTIARPPHGDSTLRITTDNTRASGSESVSALSLARSSPIVDRTQQYSTDRARYKPLYCPVTRRTLNAASHPTSSRHHEDQHGPCRNRTYNLAIKSRLLCQLS